MFVRRRGESERVLSLAMTIVPTDLGGILADPDTGTIPRFRSNYPRHSLHHPAPIYLTMHLSPHSLIAGPEATRSGSGASVLGYPGPTICLISFRRLLHHLD